jgi:hypothetical protein
LQNLTNAHVPDSTNVDSEGTSESVQKDHSAIIRRCHPQLAKFALPLISVKSTFKSDATASPTGSESEKGLHNDWSHEETDDPVYADERNFYKVECWTNDRRHITNLLYAGTISKSARSLHDGHKFLPGPALHHSPRHSRPSQLAGEMIHTLCHMQT